MKNFSRRLTKTAPLILLGLILDHSPVHQNAQALVGGPFDDNNYGGGAASADGTYSGTISGHNLTGIVTFGVSSSQETNGRFSIFHEGFVHYGAATGIADLQSRRVAGSLLGVATLGGSGTAGGGVNITDSAGGTGTGGTNTGTLTVRSGVEGSFVARMKGYPNFIKFEGKGRVHLRQERLADDHREGSLRLDVTIRRDCRDNASSKVVDPHDIDGPLALADGS